jgi:hypothetical protein
MIHNHTEVTTTQLDRADTYKHRVTHTFTYSRLTDRLGARGRRIVRDLLISGVLYPQYGRQTAPERMQNGGIDGVSGMEAMVDDNGGTIARPQPDAAAARKEAANQAVARMSRRVSGGGKTGGMGRQWADEWHPITFLKRRKPDAGDGLYERARAMEAVKYATECVVGQEGAAGVRHSPRLAEAQEERI